MRCPKSCELAITFAPDGSIASICGEGCRLGTAYATEEITDPKRIVTASISIAGSMEPLSVKTAAAVSRTQVFKVLDEIKALKLKAPITTGTILKEDIAKTGVSLVATKSIG